jgi:hypothetical protein
MMVAFIVGPPAVCVLVVAAALLATQNGSELVLSDETWIERQGAGLFIFQSYRGDAKIAVSAIEVIRCTGWQIVIETDAQIHQIRCATRTGARWMQRALLSAAVYGPKLNIDGTKTG